MLAVSSRYFLVAAFLWIGAPHHELFFLPLVGCTYSHPLFEWLLPGNVTGSNSDSAVLHYVIYSMEFCSPKDCQPLGMP
ncbi:hypothetical protein [Vreelandella alkaliphila]|uniref:hypothetical protein n=1 Tax=Vreelandella alkaliphila TaxID=272774 RepID=UPI001C3EF546|nr:hypothetical protein [Halomonas humidisoli]